LVELEALQNSLSQFEARGAAVVALCPQLTEFNQAVVSELNLGFPVLQDRENAVATAFGLTLATPPKVIEAERFLGLDLPAHNGTDNWNLPMPARFVVDRSSVIRFASVHADHRTRSEPSECLEFCR
jgi:peroxiredoxin